MSNKNKKIWLIIAAIFVLGLGLTIVGLLAGGAGQARQILSEEEKNQKGISKYVHMTSDGFLIGKMSEEEKDDDDDDVSWEDEKELNEIETSPDELIKIAEARKVSELVLKLGAGEFVIRESADDAIAITEGEKLKVGTKLTGETLTIQAKPQNKRWSDWSESNGAGRLEIYLPKKQYEGIKIEMGAGELELVSALETGDLNIKIGAGEMDAEDITADSVRAEIGAGSLEINRMKADTLYVDVAMGACEVEKAEARDMDIHVAMGETAIGVIGSEQDTSYRIECQMGEVQIGSKRISGMGSERQQSSGANAKLDIDVECGMGEVDISFEQ